MHSHSPFCFVVNAGSGRSDRAAVRFCQRSDAVLRYSAQSRFTPVACSRSTWLSRTANWIVATSVKSAEGTFWREAETGQRIVTYNRTFDLYSGISGTSLFLIEAYRASNNRTYLATATSSADYVLHSLNGILAKGHDSILGHAGVAGIGYFLTELWQQTGNVTYKQAADRCVAFVLSKATKTTTGLRLHNVHNIHWFVLHLLSALHALSFAGAQVCNRVLACNPFVLVAAGIALYLLHTYKYTKDAALLQTVTDAARDLLSFGQASSRVLLFANC